MINEALTRALSGSRSKPYCARAGILYPVRTACGNGYVWEWSAVARSTKSRHTFDLFFDCLDDARMHGYEPHFIDDATGISQSFR